MGRVGMHERHVVIELDPSQLEVYAEQVDDTTLRLRCTFEVRVPRDLLPHPVAGIDERLVHPEAEGV